MGLVFDADNHIERLLIRGQELTHLDTKIVKIAGLKKPTVVPDAALQSFLHSSSIFKSFKHLSTCTDRIRFSAQPAILSLPRSTLYEDAFLSRRLQVCYTGLIRSQQAH